MYNARTYQYVSGLRARALALLLFVFVGCSSDDEPSADPIKDIDSPDLVAPTDVSDGDVVEDVQTLDVADGEVESVDAPDIVDTVDAEAPVSVEVKVTALLDGEPEYGVRILQAGLPEQHWHTNLLGQVTVQVDLTIQGDVVLVGSHPEARIRAVEIVPGFIEEEIIIDLVRFPPDDNPEYEFQPAGEPGKSPTTEYCGHCHVTLVADWFGSVHRQSASNPVVQDLYAGSAGALADPESCVAAGGQWLSGLIPGTGDTGERCYLGAGVLPSLNPGCGSPGSSCDGEGEEFGGCADCHAPSIDGQLGGRDLLEATGWAYDWGVQCEVCHKVESVDLNSMEPGVAGRLRIVRPSDPSFSTALGMYAPLTFGPAHDTVNVRMGSVQRDHFHQSRLCSGCHEQEQKVLVPGASIDLDRWPSGRLPIHSTFSEWKAGPMNPAAPCQSCHMPPNPKVTNSSDQQLRTEAPIGFVAGWIRPPGSTKHHTWDGPRTPESGMLELAAGVFISHSVAAGVLTVKARTRNVGPGHAIPTGEPMRSMVLTVEASCDGQPLKPTGGDVVPSFGGYLARKATGEDWLVWPGAEPGQVIRVVSRPGDHYDYEGYGPFGDGTFSAEQKGMPVEQWAGESTIVSVDAGVVTLDQPLPFGDVAYRVGGWARAGEPGFGFARVLAGADGAEMVPHFLAVDVLSDNRLLPQQSWTSNHEFEASCEEPQVTAVLYHRNYPPALAAERGWAFEEAVMATVVK